MIGWYSNFGSDLFQLHCCILLNVKPLDNVLFLMNSTFSKLGSTILIFKAQKGLYKWI